jgi:hypothetical protein
MKCVCLIPSTRPDLLPDAVASAEADGWDVIVETDPNRTGASATRNRLLDRAFQEGYDLIRYSDDDDILLPHREAILPLFAEGTDVVYTDYRLIEHGHPRSMAMFSNPRWAILNPPDCWGWIATADALKQVVKRTGELWSPALLAEGFFVFLELFRAGLKIQHCAIQAYEYRRVEGRLHSFNDGGIWLARYRQEVEETKKNYPHLFD